MTQPLPSVARTAFTFPAAPMSPAIVAGMRGAMWATPASASDELVEALVADGSDAAVLAACVMYGQLPHRLNRPHIARAFQGLVARAQTEADAGGLAWTPALDALHGHHAYALDPDPAFPGREPARARLQRLIPWMAAWAPEDARAAFGAFASEALRTWRAPTGITPG